MAKNVAKYFSYIWEKKFRPDFLKIAWSGHTVIVRECTIDHRFDWFCFNLTSISVVNLNISKGTELMRPLGHLLSQSIVIVIGLFLQQ